MYLCYKYYLCCILYRSFTKSTYNILYVGILYFAYVVQIKMSKLGNEMSPNGKNR